MDGEAVLINLASGMYYSMTDAGSHVWSLIEARHSAAHIARSLAAHYRVSMEQAEARREPDRR